jgi:hypothetical protein
MMLDANSKTAGSCLLAKLFLLLFAGVPVHLWLLFDASAGRIKVDLCSGGYSMPL